MTSSRIRLALLLALVPALWWWRDARMADSDVRAAPRASPVAGPASRAPVPGPGADDVCVVPAALPQRAKFALLSAAGPFSEPPAPLPRQAARSEAPPPVASEPPPPPPPKLPYRFYGVYNEPGKPAMVFLGLGAALIHARAGDTLEGGFRLESIGRRELSFVHVQQNVTLRMPIDGEPS